MPAIKAWLAAAPQNEAELTLLTYARIVSGVKVCSYREIVSTGTAIGLVGGINGSRAELSMPLVSSCASQSKGSSTLSVLHDQEGSRSQGNSLLGSVL